VFQPCLEIYKVIIIIITTTITVSHQLGLDRPVSAWICKMASTFSFFPPEFGEICKPVQYRQKEVFPSKAATTTLHEALTGPQLSCP
jgi:hypothetical protein